MPVDPPPPPPAKVPSLVQKILYNGVPTPIHQDALDLIPEVNYWKFHFNTVSCMVPVETPLGTPKARSQSVKAQRSVTHLIKKRISARYRVYNLDRRQPFSVNKSHTKLIHHFTMEYMVKGVNGLPVYEDQEDDTDTDEEYENRVLSNNIHKASDYELIMNDRATAENRLAFRARKERNAQSQSGQRKMKRSPKKRVTVKTAKPRSINMSSALISNPSMQPEVLINRLQASDEECPPKRRLFSANSPQQETLTTVATVHMDNLVTSQEKVVLAFEDL